MSGARYRSAPPVFSQCQAVGRQVNPSVTNSSGTGSRPRSEIVRPAASKGTTAAHAKPSAKLNARTINPFDDKTPKSVFETSYINGAVPCRLQHGSVKHKLQWTTPPENLNFDPILVTLAEGLREKRHPYTFVATEGFKQMLLVEDAEERTIPLLPKLVPPIRQALASSDTEIFFKSLEALIQLSDVTGPELNPYLKSVLPQIARRILDKNHRDKVITGLQRLEYNGGKVSSFVSEWLKVVKRKPNEDAQ